MACTEPEEVGCARVRSYFCQCSGGNGPGAAARTLSGSAHSALVDEGVGRTLPSGNGCGGMKVAGETASSRGEGAAALQVPTEGAGKARVQRGASERRAPAIKNASWRWRRHEAFAAVFALILSMTMVHALQVKQRGYFNTETVKYEYWGEGGRRSNDDNRGLTGDDAESFCVGRGGNLARVDSEEAHEAISSLIGRDHLGVWIGLRWKGVSWEWSAWPAPGARDRDGHSLDFSRFHEGEREGGRGKDCVVQHSITGQWHDHPCDAASAKFALVCEFTSRPSGNSSHPSAPGHPSDGGGRPGRATRRLLDATPSASCVRLADGKLVSFWVRIVAPSLRNWAVATVPVISCVFCCCPSIHPHCNTA